MLRDYLRFRKIKKEIAKEKKHEKYIFNEITIYRHNYFTNDIDAMVIDHSLTLARIKKLEEGLLK